jgi:hypothetical protein
LSAVLIVAFICAGNQKTIAQAELPPAERSAEIESAAQLLDLFGIDETFFNQFQNGKPFDVLEQEPLARVLMRLPQVKLIDLKRWTQRDVAWDDISKRPEEYRRQFLRIEGRVRRVVKLSPTAEVQSRFALDNYYRCEVTIDQSNQTAIVFARTVPEAWALDTPLNESASAAALFLKTGPESPAGKPDLCFAADRVAWHPATPLGRLGMDYGLFDTIEQARPITNSERECFYQMLAAAGRAPAEPLAASNLDPSSHLGPLMREPQAHTGEAYAFRGIARSAIKIHISGADAASRHGFDHYYEVVVFLELNGILEVAGQKFSSYPVVFCVRELPSDMPTGDEIGEVVRARGFMFKKWPYTTEMTEQKNSGLRMTSPLLIGRTLFWERREQAPSLIGPVAAGVIVLVIAGVLCMVWSFRRADRRARHALGSRRSAAQSPPSLDEIDLDITEPT